MGIIYLPGSELTEQRIKICKNILGGAIFVPDGLLGGALSQAEGGVQGQQTVLEVIHLQSKHTLCTGTVLPIPHTKTRNNSIFSNIFPFYKIQKMKTAVSSI
jgi:hypothetical protein